MNLSIFIHIKGIDDLFYHGKGTVIAAAYTVSLTVFMPRKYNSLEQTLGMPASRGTRRGSMAN